MKTKQSTKKVQFTAERSNAKNFSNEKEKVSHYLLIDKKTEKTVVDCRVYMGRSSSASTVHASIWVSLRADKKPETWVHPYTSGSGSASGYGYHKESAAIAGAIRSAGIELYGCEYANIQQGEKINFKNAVHFGGCGESAQESALLAIAHAAGYSDCIFVRC